MSDRPRIVDGPRPTRRRDARKAGHPRRPTVEALEVRSLLSVAGSPDYSYAAGSTVPGESLAQFVDSPDVVNYTTGEALQSDGKDVIVGYIEPNINVVNNPYTVPEAYAARLNADGTLDTTFGTKGNGMVGLPAVAGTMGEQVAIQPNGQIVVAANLTVATFGTATEIALYRLNADGSIDTSFGTNGEVTAASQQGSNTYDTSATALAIQSNGDIVVGGLAASEGPVLFRFNSDGTPDTNFGTDGQVLANFTIDMQTPFDLGGVAGLVIQPGGAIDFDTTVAPTSSAGYEIAVGQLTTSGSFDPTFGNGGQVILPFSSPVQGSAGALALQSDGKLIVAGSYYDDTAGSTALQTYFDIYRLNADGSLDTTFGTMGEATAVNYDGQTDGDVYTEDTVNSVLIEPDGEILVGGMVSTNANGTNPGDTTPELAGFNADGSLDDDFGVDGVESLPLNDSDQSVIYNGLGPSFYGLMLESGGKILALTNDGVAQLLATGATNDFEENGTTDLAVLLTNFSVPVFAYQTASLATTTPANLDAIGITGAGQTLPAPGAYDGDGIDELGVYLPSIGAFAVQPYSNPTVNNTGAGDYIDYIGPQGIGSAIPAPADYTGSGHTEIGVYDVATGSFIYSPEAPSNVAGASAASSDVTVPFGIPGAGQSIPVPADYDGTGLDDIAVYLAASGVWAIQDPSGNSAGQEIAFGPQGIGNAIPAPADYDDSGHIELGLYLPSIGAFAYLPYNGGPAVITAFGMPGAGNSIPMPGDYDGSGHTELAVYMPSLDAFAYRPYGDGPDVIEAFGAVGASIPFSAAGAQADSGTGGGAGGGNAAPRGGLDEYVDFVPDLAGQPKKNGAGGSFTTTTQAQS